MINLRQNEDLSYSPCIPWQCCHCQNTLDSVNSFVTLLFCRVVGKGSVWPHKMLWHDRAPRHVAEQRCCSLLSPGNKFPVWWLAFCVDCTVTGGKTSMERLGASGGKWFKHNTVEELECCVWSLLLLAAQQQNSEVERKGMRTKKMRGSKWGLKNCC